MKLVVDSNIFISSLDPKDDFHLECYPIFEWILNLEIQAQCPALILVEVACVLTRRTKEKAPKDILVFEPVELVL